MSTASIAANAYASLARITDAAGGLTKPGGDAAPNFGALLKDAVGTVMEAGRKSDLQTQAVAAGKANIVDVVSAVAETEVAVETLVSVRDKVIQAYQEILHMQI
jgi:flagellar hook-basal body complex protein FliE